MRLAWFALLTGSLVLPTSALRGETDVDLPIDCADCADCAEWNQVEAPFRIYGNTYYVGVRGLSSVLISTSGGLVLLDAALPQSAPLVEANIRALGFKVEDIKLILNSHAHYCLAVVYADSLNAVSAEGFRFLGGPKNPDVSERFRQSIATVEALPCDILLTVHPGFSKVFDKLAQRTEKPGANPFRETGACKAYAAAARIRLEERLEAERKQGPSFTSAP